MSLSRAFSKAIGRWLIGVLLFAQLAVASYACPGVTGMASMPSNAAPGTAVAAMPPGCDQLDPNAANLCAEHCHHGQQSADTTPAPVVLAAIPTLLYALPLEPARLPGFGRSLPAPDASLAAAPPPPHAILHCVFRI